MKKYLILIITILSLGMIWSCDVTETKQNGDVEDTILNLILTDNAGAEFEGFENEDDFSLSKNPDETQVESAVEVDRVRDSSYVWRFGRTAMHREREITVEIEDDTSALALISNHITGIFHVRQFNRLWTSDSTWERGDSVQFSHKPIDFNLNQHVVYHKRINAEGEEQWKKMSSTLAYGSSSEAISIQSLGWVRQDSLLVMENFGENFYTKSRALLSHLLRSRQLQLTVSNSASDTPDLVKASLIYVPQTGRILRKRFGLGFNETLESGANLYSRRLAQIDFVPQIIKGTIEVIDARTLFDHSFTEYASATVAYSFQVRQRQQ